MDHFEMVEKLRQKANVSYEEAKAALEASDWDILDALVLLESEGKVKNENGASEYTTQETSAKHIVEETADWKENLRRLWNYLRKLFRKGNANNFVVRGKKGKVETEMPVTVLILLLIFIEPFAMIAFVGGLLCGCRYSFQGPDVNGKVNDAMDKAADAVQKDNDQD